MKISISGVRGIYGKDLTPKTISTIIRAFSSYLKNKKGESYVINIIIGRDTRTSSEIIQSLIESELINCGINVYSLNIAPTPIIFHESRKYDAGIIVTASHNPDEWNGLKLIIDGRGIFEQELDEIMSINNNQFNNIFGKFYHNTKYDYVVNVEKLLSSLISIQKNDLYYGIDSGGGATCDYVDSLFKKLNNKFILINGNKFISSRTADPTTDNLNDLKTLIKSKQDMFFGFAFDLDGDRVVVVDNTGTKLDPDMTLLLCLASTKVNLQYTKFVASLDTSLSIRDFIKSYNCTLDYSKVGEANVVKKMIEVSADAGGEGSSAGFIIPKFNMCRDGFLASAIISKIDKNTLNDCIGISSKYKIIRQKLLIEYNDISNIMNKIFDLLKPLSTEIINIDGVKAVIDDDSWILIRPSNTEHALRISIESTPYKINNLFDQISEKIMNLHE